MAPVIRTIDTGAELDAFLARAARGFGFSRDPEADRARRAVWETAVAHVAVDGEHGIVGTTAWFPFDLTVPGGATVAMAGTTLVTVAGTHRRRGVLRSLLTEHLDAAVAAGFSCAGLWASEAPIYGRFGYGSAARRPQLRIDAPACRVRGDLGADVPVRFAEPDEAVAHATAVYAAHAAIVPGSLSRTAAWWDGSYRADPPGTRGGATERRWVLAPDGYAHYRLRQRWEHGRAAGVVELGELVATTTASRAALWRFVLSIDLFTVVETGSVSGDDEVWWLVDDPRALGAGPLLDTLWVRVLDVPAVLGARTYGVDDRFVVEVRDALRPDGNAGGRWLVEAGPSGADVRRAPSGEGPDVVMDVRELGAVVLGGTSAAVLARAGLIEERTPGAVARLNRFVLADPPPMCTTFF
jgi:predicted acetyltransferase